MNLSRVIVSVTEFCARPWFESRLASDPNALPGPVSHAKRGPCLSLLARSAAVGTGFLALSASAQLALIEVAEEHFAKGRYEQALQRFQEIIKNPFAAPADIAVSQCRVGVIRSIQNDQGGARKSLEDAIRGGALPSKHAAICYYALLQIYVLEQANVEARDLVRKMGDVQLTPLYVARTWALASEVGARLEDTGFEVMHLQKLLQVMEKNRIEEVEIKILSGRRFRLEEIRKRLGMEGQAESRQTPPPAKTPMAAAMPSVSATPAAAPIRAAANAVPLPGGSDPTIHIWKLLREGDLGTVRSRLEAGVQDKSVSAAFRASGLGFAPERILARVSRLQSDDPRNLRVGVVLPAGTVYTRVNSRILRSLSSFASSSALKGVNYTFSVKAISPEPGAAEAAALDLLLDEHVHAIVGPVSNAQVLGVQSAAALFGVPVFALGPVSASSELFLGNLVRLGLLARSQTRLLVRHLQEDLHFRNAAVMAPDDPYGYEMATAFSEVAKETAFPISGVSFYPAAAEVFKDAVETAIGPQSKGSRKAELEELLKKVKKRAQQEKKHFDPKRVMLPPMLSFDAIFVPESLGKARMIASTFAFLGAEVVHYLGDRQWVEGANGRSSIADAFMNGARVPMAANGAFLSYLRRDLGFSDLSLDLERQAFDALVFLRTAQYRAGGNGAAKLLQAMHAPDWSAEGVGLYGPVDSTGEPAGKFMLGAYKGGKIEAQLPAWSVEDQSKALFELQPTPKGE